MSKINITIPTSWGGVSLNQWRDLLEVASDRGLSDIELNIEILSVLTGIPSDEILGYGLSDVSEMLRQITFIGTPPEPEKKIKNSYLIGGVKYNVFKKMTEITTAQYIDFQSYSKDMDKNVAEILACFLIPEGHKYNEGYDIDETIKAIKGNDGINVREALGLMSFFGKLLVKSIRSSLVSSKKIAKKMTQTTNLKKTEKEKIQKKLKILDSFGSLF